ncbi:hypothetical protein CJ030_MR2G005188 [Morella rubra]|uniref:GRF-type domain-containing protein n=1 Tax=Morella rubra TaxID=262757 RepID=A0A6A1WAU1_9ROSI|nr:hypothetical protein CJ030_MR2G005188 [Morella rubra]
MYSDSQSSSCRSGVFKRGVVSNCSGGQQPDGVICGCDHPARLRTSLTNFNLRRRFYGCPMFGSKWQSGCNFFQWIDPLTCLRGMQVLPPMLKKIKKLEDEAHKHKEKEKRMTCYLVGSWVITIGTCLCMYKLWSSVNESV